MTSPTEMAGIIGRLGVSFSRTFTSDEELMALAEEWCKVLDGYDLADVDLARAGVVADPHLRYFPSTDDFRRRVQLARADRRREDGSGDGCSACVGSGGSIGWQVAGTDERGRDYVRGCPRGCRPPSPAQSHRREYEDGGLLTAEQAEVAKGIVRDLAARLRAGTLDAPPPVSRDGAMARLLAAAGPDAVHPHDAQF
jgi:hypothetical protein